MKNHLLSFVAFLLMCNFSVAQNSVQLNIHHKLGASDFAMNQASANNLDNNFKVTRLEYYISEISITHDGGTRTNIEDQWILVDAGETTEIDLGSHDITSVEMITFHVGVDQAHNHLDPASYDSEHPLAPQLPSMHWGWSSGYRFVAMEGLGGASFNQTFQLHGLGDNNYFRTDVLVAATPVNNALVLDIDADYTRALEDINVSGGLIVHGEFAEAKKVLENFRDHVFTATNTSTSTVDFSEVQGLAVFPNPTPNGHASLLVSATGNQVYQVTITDVLGRQIRQYDVVPSNTNLDINLQNAGLYFINLHKEGQVVMTQKLMMK